MPTDVALCSWLRQFQTDTAAGNFHVVFTGDFGVWSPSERSIPCGSSSSWQSSLSRSLSIRHLLVQWPYCPDPRVGVVKGSELGAQQRSCAFICLINVCEVFASSRAVSTVVTR
jgi:hypothetical protein